MKMDKHTILYHLSVATLFMAIILLFVFRYLLLLDGNNVIEYKGPMKIVDVGQKEITVALEYCKTRYLPVEVYVSYVDGIIYSLPVKTSASLPLGCNTVNKVYDLPEKIPNGVYHLDVDTSLKVNRLRTITEHWETEQFEVKR